MKGGSFPLGLVTSIGSLPHNRPSEAVAFVLEHQPELPAAPSIPTAEPREGMVAQAAWGVAGVIVEPDGTLTVDRTALDPEAPLADTNLDGPPFTTLRTFLRAVAGRDGPVKLQLTGPVTLGLALQADGVATELAFRIARNAVKQRALQLLAVAGVEAAAASLVVFLDEPALVGGLRPGFPLDADQTIDLVSGALATLEPRAITGLHCCGRSDWRVLLQAGPQVLSLPVDAGIDGSAGAVGAFLDRGGWLAWGAVPTDRPLGDHTSRLWRRLSSEWCELVEGGCDPVALRRQALITPVCGLAMHGEAQAHRVLALTREVAERLYDQMLGVRLSVGA